MTTAVDFLKVQLMLDKAKRAKIKVELSCDSAYDSVKILVMEPHRLRVSFETVEEVLAYIEGRISQVVGE
jgi:hypothetical protein